MTFDPYRGRPADATLTRPCTRMSVNRTQLIVAPHSDLLVRFLKPAEVMVINSADDRLAQLTWADQLDLDEWLADYTLNGA